MGCVGDVDAGGGMVCVVAGLADWVCSVGIVDGLICMYNGSTKAHQYITGTCTSLHFTLETKREH